MTTLEVSLSMAERGDHAAARALVEDIARHGRKAQEDYVLALVVLCDRVPGANDIFTLLCATPAQVAAAYREATKL